MGKSVGVYPLCTSSTTVALPCSRAGYPIKTYNALLEQDRGIESLQRSLMRYRLAALTPEVMRTELTNLETRIAAARHAKESSNG